MNRIKNLIKRKLRNIYIRHFYLPEEEWHIGLRKKTNKDLLDGNFIDFEVNYKDHNYWYADPFLFEYEGETYVFAEMYDRAYNKGSIGVSKIVNDKISKFKKCIDAPYHFSYPCIFEKDNKIYMIPETCENHSVDIYECINFPYKWKLVDTLINKAFVDTTPVPDSDYYLATSLLLPNEYNNNLYLINKDKIKNIYHDELKVRSAGHLFYKNNVLIRPCQNCEITYGGSIIFNKFSLNKNSIKESKILEVYPKDFEITKKYKAQGVHTYNSSNHYEVIDFKNICFNPITAFNVKLKRCLENRNHELLKRKGDFVLNKLKKIGIDNHKYREIVKTNIRNHPKICYIIPGCSISGGIGVVLQHVNRIQERGYTVLIASEDNNREIPWFTNQNVKIVGVNELEDDIDIAVATGWTTAYALQNIKAKKKCYFVQSDETRFYDDLETKDKVSKTYEMDYEFLSEAKWICKWLRDNYAKECHYVPNGLDEDLFHKIEYPNKKRKLRILLEGSIGTPYKGMEDAFRAVDGLDAEIWCVSNGNFPKKFWKCDMFFNKISMSDMKYIYSACDILLKMSKVEGFFGPPLEMMSCEGACVVSKVSGYNEYIKDEYNALVVEKEDIKKAHKYLEKLISDESLRNKLITNGQVTVKKWTWDHSIDLLEDFIKEMENSL